MYQIGLFSKMNRITTKTLRHYDEIGLLKPAFVDEFTGYRYYSSEQLPRLHQIITLKQMGLGLLEINQIIAHASSVEVYLKLKEQELEETIQENSNQLGQIRSYLHRLKGENRMIYNPVIRTLPKVIVASMRMIAPNYNAYFDLIPQMGAQMQKQGAICAVPAYCFNIYHDGEYKECDIDVEVCEAVVAFCEDSEKVRYKIIDEVSQAICVLHRGPYELLREAYAFAFQWIEDNGYSVVGLPRESYIDGIWNKDHEEEWLTEVQIPIRK